MRMARFRLALEASIILFLLAAGPLPAAELVLPQAEAPTEIFSAKIGDADVDLSILGSWTAALSFGKSLLFAPGLPVQIQDSFPSLDLGFIPLMTPDVTISLRMMEKYFLEVSALGSFADNSILFGYQGDSSEMLRRLAIGTKGIEQEPSAFLQTPSQAANSLGAFARLAAGSSLNELLLRWDATGVNSKVFVGKNELDEERIPLDSYIRGRFFYLPDTVVENLEVYLEDPAGTLAGGDSKRYRRAGFDDVIVDSLKGLVTLRAAGTGRVLAFYRKGALQVGDPGMGVDGLPGQTGARRDLSAPEVTFEWGIGLTYLGSLVELRRINLPGIGDCLLLWEPGDASPFEICNTYQLAGTPPADVSRVSFDLVEKIVGAAPAQGILYEVDTAARQFSVLVDRETRASFGNFYPFPDPTGLLYGPERNSLTGKLGYEIAAQFLTPVDAYLLEADIVPGSVQVTVNGVAETRFEVEPSSGALTFHVEIAPTDRIEVRWRKGGLGLSGGDLLFTARSSIPLSQAVALDLAAGLRWNVDPWSFSPQPYARSGTLIASAGLKGEMQGAAGRGLTWSAQVGAAYTNPDTTGVLRLFGMEGHSMGVDLSEEAAYPASPPDPSTPPEPSVLVGLTKSNRGMLLYRDYRSYGALGSASLQSIDWLEAPAALAYANGSRSGPYNVLGSSAGKTVGRSLVMDFDLLTGEWAGAQMPIAGGGDVDLSDARSLTIRMKARDVAVSSDFQLHVQIGSVGEDLDDDSTLDEEVSATEDGFFFDLDPPSGDRLKVGASPRLESNGIRDSEDRNANGILDAESPPRVVTITLPSLHLTGDRDWMTAAYSFTDADRSRLLAARSVRLVITALSGSIGRVLVDSVSIEKSPFWIETPALTGSVAAREVSEPLSLHDPGPGARLEDMYPGTTDRFHPGAERQEVLEIDWSQLLTPQLSVAGYAEEGTGGIGYDAVVYNLRTTGLTSPATLSFSLRDSDGKGVSWSIASADLPAGSWSEVRVSRSAGSVSIDGAAIPGTVVFDEDRGDLRWLRLDVSGSPDGTVYIDEVKCVDPRGAWGAAFIGDLTARFPGTILKAGGIPLLANASVEQHVSLATAGFSSLYGVPLAAEDLSSRTRLAADVLYARISADVVLREFDGSFGASGGHRITVPNVAFPVTVTDAFSVTADGAFSREDAIDIRPTGAFSLAVSSRADATEDLLSQAWLANSILTPAAGLSLSTGLELTQALTGYALSPQWYGARWAQEFALIAPVSGGDNKTRGEQFNGRLAFQPGPGTTIPWTFDLSGRAAATASDFSDADRTQKNDLDMALSVQYRFMQGEATVASLGMSYARTLALTAVEPAGERFSAEASSYVALISPQAYLLTGIPFFEIFAETSPAILPLWPASVESGSYSPTATLTFQRTYGSRLRDLFLPSFVELSVGQELMRTADLSQATIFIRPKLVSRAANLFGRLGSLPLIRCFRTDEYSMSVSASLEGASAGAMIWTELAAEAYASLSGFEGQELTLVESFRREERSILTISNATQLLYDWSFYPASGASLKFLPSEIGKTGYFSHRESAELTVRYQDSGAFHPLNIVVGHGTTLVYPEHGSLKASLSIGMDIESLTAGELAYRLAFRAGLEAKLTF
jgi:hypothetical protein